ncbi:MAG: Hsp20/alpha crystallin family protein [Bacteroidia bacterium]|nr:Hsp20/alpha crystallin family protein [Bacteroidia bacterium]
MTLVKRNRFFPTTLWDDFLKNDWLDTTPGFNSPLPAVNIKETPENFLLELAAPGMSKDDFKVNLENNVLTISSSKENKHEETNEDGAYTRREFSYSSFSRSFRLPEMVNSEKIEAKYTDGVLYLTLPKREEAKLKAPKEIEIA